MKVHTVLTLKSQFFSFAFLFVPANYGTLTSDDIWNNLDYFLDPLCPAALLAVVVV